jgi:hypothetical protein
MVDEFTKGGEYDADGPLRYGEEHSTLPTKKGFEIYAPQAPTSHHEGNP